VQHDCSAIGVALGTADLHIHTRYGDGMATVPEVFRYVEDKSNLDVIGITEHDTLRAADEARELHARGAYRFDLVCGMEVTTLDGHLLALFIEEPVASFQRMEETLAAIHAQGGLAVVPHPLSWLTRSVGTRVLERIAASADPAIHFDGIEEYNLSPAGRVSSARARRMNQERYHLAALGGSDAHFLQSIGSAWTEFPGKATDDLRQAISMRTTLAKAGRAPHIAELGYRNVMLQQWRGIMATPRNMGWVPTIRSFIVSHGRRPHSTTGPASEKRPR
jgi:predicted metal-dependent phosphoesterase TrpH